MKDVRIWSLGVATSLALAGCASSYQVVRMPQREADLYPLSQTKAGITVAIDEVKSAARAERYFGANLIEDGILPVNIVLSNYGARRVVIKPSDIVLFRGKAMMDPLPIEVVAEAAKRQRRLRSRTEERVDNFFVGIAFKEAVLLPKDTYQGVMFFATPRPEKKARDAFFRVLSMFGEGGPRMRVGVTDLETGDRLHFGPFSLSLPEGTPPFFRNVLY